MSDKIGEVVIYVRSVDRPWLWLAAGWRDLERAPSASLSYGGVIFAVSWLLTAVLAQAELWWVLVPSLFGFVLVAPFLAAGLYEISRLGDLERPASLVGSFAAFRRHASQLGLMGALLLMIHLAWAPCAVLLFAACFGDGAAGLRAGADILFFSERSLLFVLIGCLVGAVFAMAAFVLSATSIPMIVHRDVSVVQAVTVSVKVCRANWPAMALWAGLIAAFTAVGLATYYVGLVVLLPLVGHAAWRAYRDLVGDDTAEACKSGRPPRRAAVDP